MLQPLLPCKQVLQAHLALESLSVSSCNSSCRRCMVGCRLTHHAEPSVYINHRQGAAVAGVVAPRLSICSCWKSPLRRCAVGVQGAAHAVGHLLRTCRCANGLLYGAARCTLRGLMLLLQALLQLLLHGSCQDILKFLSCSIRDGAQHSAAGCRLHAHKPLLHLQLLQATGWRVRAQRSAGCQLVLQHLVQLHVHVHGQCVIQCAACCCCFGPIAAAPRGAVVGISCCVCCSVSSVCTLQV
jgi:hypothetical protein